MRPFIAYSCILITFFCLASCLDEDQSNSVSLSSTIKNLKAYDVGNNGNASDIFIKFSIPASVPISFLKLFLVRSSEDTFNPETLTSEQNITSFIELETEIGGFYEFSVPGSLRDLNGSPILKDEPYNLYIVPERTDQRMAGTERVSITLTDVDPRVGPYLGVWGDDLDGSLAVSTQIEFDPTTGEYSGPFYFSNRFEPCCGGENDGTLSFFKGLGDSLRDFRYEQFLNSFSSSGDCAGLFGGLGKVSKFIRLEFQYTGNDCVGAHSGTLVFEKQ